MQQLINAHNSPMNLPVSIFYNRKFAVDAPFQNINQCMRNGFDSKGIIILQNKN